MAHTNRIHQLEDIANDDPRHEGRYGPRAQENRVNQLEDLANKDPQYTEKYKHLSAGEMSTFSTQNGTTHLVPVPVTLKAQIGSPTALAIGAFSTSITTLSLSLMEFRGVTTANVYIGNFFFVAGIGMVISAQWEMVLGNTYAYTVLSAFGFFYGGFGAILTPFFGVAASYGKDEAQYYNALAFFVVIWAVWNFFFLLGSLPLNLTYIGIFGTVEMTFILVAAAYFKLADGDLQASQTLQKTGGAFAFVCGIMGYYLVCNLMCQETFFFSFPLGDTSRFFRPRSVRNNEGER